MFASTSQSGKVERTLRPGSGTGELSFFFGMRHVGNKLNYSVIRGLRHLIVDYPKSKPKLALFGSASLPCCVNWQIEGRECF